MSPIPPPRTLFTLFTHPTDDPAGWHAAELRDASTSAPTMAVVRLPTGRPAPALRRATRAGATWSALASGIRRLHNAGTQTLGHISLGYGTRPLPDVLADLTHWAGLGAAGVFYDHAPTGQPRFDRVVRATRVAHHNGLTHIVLNAGGPVNPLYRRLDATICTFEGLWTDYVTWSGDGAEPGDGHLIFDVPRRDQPAARALAAARNAGLCLIAEQRDAYSDNEPSQHERPQPVTATESTAPPQPLAQPQPPMPTVIHR